MREQLIVHLKEYRQEAEATDALIATQMQELRSIVAGTVARSTQLVKEVAELQRDLVVSNARAIGKGISLVLQLTPKKVS